MLKVEIPGRPEVELKWLVLDFNGTIALDGMIIPEIIPLLMKIGEELEIFVLTADTFGSAAEQCSQLPVKLHMLVSNDHTREKGEFVAQLGSDQVVAIGNGQNDLEMIREARVGIAVVGPEGCALNTLQNADLVVPGIASGLELLVNPKRLIATLRR